MHTFTHTATQVLGGLPTDTSPLTPLPPQHAYTLTSCMLVHSQWGRVALHLAAEEGHTDVVKLLADHKADIDAIKVGECAMCDVPVRDACILEHHKTPCVDAWGTRGLIFFV